MTEKNQDYYLMKLTLFSPFVLGIFENRRSGGRMALPIGLLHKTARIRLPKNGQDIDYCDRVLIFFEKYGII